MNCYGRTFIIIPFTYRTLAIEFGAGIVALPSLRRYVVIVAFVVHAHGTASTSTKYPFACTHRTHTISTHSQHPKNMEKKVQKSEKKIVSEWVFFLLKCEYDG